MKKLILSLAIVTGLSLCAEAQTPYKQDAGNKNLEVMFAPLGGSPISMGGIKYRAFSSETMAFRLTTFIGFGSEKEFIGFMGEPDSEGELTEEYYSTTSNLDISLRPGIEFHMPGTDRLSPYYGGELLLGYSSTTMKTDTDYMDVTTDPENPEMVYGAEDTEKSGSLNFGLNAFAGVDYYFAENIYVGTELGFGFGFNMGLDTEVDNAAAEDVVTTPGDSSFNLGPNVVGQIRLGFLF